MDEREIFSCSKQVVNGRIRGVETCNNQRGTLQQCRACMYDKM